MQYINQTFKQKQVILFNKCNCKVQTRRYGFYFSNRIRSSASHRSIIRSIPQVKNNLWVLIPSQQQSGNHHIFQLKIVNKLSLQSAYCYNQHHNHDHSSIDTNSINSHNINIMSNHVHLTRSLFPRTLL